MPTAQEISARFKEIQQSIIDGLEQADGKSKFTTDTWDRPGGGGGVSRVIKHGNVFEKGGVNFSAVHGDISPEVAKMLKTDAKTFYATGVSIVIHPHSPFVPTIHMNIRYFELPDTGKYWFGGGIDLTPSYVYQEDGQHFHGVMKALCDKHSPEYYIKFKEWADNYFYIPHRNETRGIGGIFFDHLSEEKEGKSKSEIFDFVCDTGNSFLAAYLPIVEKRRDVSYNDDQKKWQLIRRGRYVEFNLVYDRGTLFGLKTNGRIESILMSLPEYASWEYAHQPEDNTPENEALSYFKKGRNWFKN